MPDLSVRGKLSLDGSQWDATMRHAGEQVDKFDTAIKGLKETIVAAFTVNAVKSMITDALELGEHVKNISDRLGISRQAVQDFGFAFKQAGGDANMLATVFDRLATSTENSMLSGEGADKLRQAFQDMGITLKDLETGSLEETFRKIMEHMSKTAADAKTISDMREIFGRGGSELIPIAKEFQEQERIGSRFALNDSDIQDLHRASQQVGTVTAWAKSIGEKWVVGMEQLFTSEGRARLSRGIPRLFSSDPKDVAATEKAKRELWGLDEKPITNPPVNHVMPHDILPGFEGNPSIVGKLSNHPEGHFSERTSAAAAVSTQSVRLRGHEDSLLRIGNFLGSNAGAINSIGQETNKILRAIHQTLKEQHQHPSQPGLTSSRGAPS